jgi:hypothetical protein
MTVQFFLTPSRKILFAWSETNFRSESIGSTAARVWRIVPCGTMRSAAYSHLGPKTLWKLCLVTKSPYIIPNTTTIYTVCTRRISLVVYHATHRLSGTKV